MEQEISQLVACLQSGVNIYLLYLFYKFREKKIVLFWFLILVVLFILLKLGVSWIRDNRLAFEVWFAFYNIPKDLIIVLLYIKYQKLKNGKADINTTR